jgi:hypothetical protein
MMVACTLSRLSAVEVEGASSIVVEFEPLELLDFLKNDFPHMNLICDRAEMFERTVELIPLLTTGAFAFETSGLSGPVSGRCPGLSGPPSDLPQYRESVRSFGAKSSPISRQPTTGAIRRARIPGRGASLTPIGVKSWRLKRRPV